MYRWIRQNMNESMFWQLTGKVIDDVPTELDIDRELREAYLRDRAENFAKRGVDASKIKIGILPPALGGALLKYTDAVGEAALFEEGLGGYTHRDMEDKVVLAFRALCEQIAKVR
jgi:hypothetical protein